MCFCSESGVDKKWTLLRDMTLQGVFILFLPLFFHCCDAKLQINCPVLVEQ